MLDILVTVGVILVLIALAALLLHLINTHQRQDVATADYERFHPGDPPESRSESDSAGNREGKPDAGGGPPRREGDA
ncbi:hypothetical protein [Streptomyces marispadix]|uniref:Secreted protein n=1 Tax=Streptomyces marispadix TaxID=2922868 RepID=A0ABS9SZ02_9ACTN|nr:hypothetical protein [Streptomyces marispadix]MCH6161271.1 hypothetical protein [Streptomyces marispadix]